MLKNYVPPTSVCFITLIFAICFSYPAMAQSSKTWPSSCNGCPKGVTVRCLTPEEWDKLDPQPAPGTGGFAIKSTCTIYMRKEFCQTVGLVDGTIERDWDKLGNLCKNPPKDPPQFFVADCCLILHELGHLKCPGRDPNDPRTSCNEVVVQNIERTCKEYLISENCRMPTPKWNQNQCFLACRTWFKNNAIQNFDACACQLSQSGLTQKECCDCRANCRDPNRFFDSFPICQSIMQGGYTPPPSAEGEASIYDLYSWLQINCENMVSGVHGCTYWNRDLGSICSEESENGNY